MIATPGVADTLRARSITITTMRCLLESLGFLEVETPVLEAAAGGADARPFVTYHNTLGRNFTLRIATELHLKRLVVGLVRPCSQLAGARAVVEGRVVRSAQVVGPRCGTGGRPGGRGCCVYWVWLVGGWLVVAPVVESG